MVKNPTKKSHFEYFEKRVRHWARVVGLTDWRIVVFHKHVKKDTAANVNADMSGRVATISLEPQWGEEPVTRQQLDRSALHEVGEILCWKLSLMALNDPAHTKAVDEEVHIIIRRIEHALIGRSK